MPEGSFIPYESGDFDLPPDLWDHIIDEGEFKGELGWFTDYADLNGNGYADIWEESVGSGIVLNPSWGHAGV